MPFVSKRQQRFMFAKYPKIAKEFASKTPNMKSLPKKLSKLKTRKEKSSGMSGMSM